MPTTPSERRFLRDLELPGADDELRVTASGDLRSIAGLENLKASVRRCAVTSPGRLLHRPDFGGGLPLSIETPLRPSDLATLQNRVRRALLRDSRVEDASVRTTRGLPGESRAAALTVELAVRPRGGEDDLSLAITVE